MLDTPRSARDDLNDIFDEHRRKIEAMFAIPARFLSKGPPQTWIGTLNRSTAEDVYNWQSGVNYQYWKRP